MKRGSEIQNYLDLGERREIERGETHRKGER